MYPILGLTTTPVKATRRDTAPRTYARLEYGEPDATWLIVGARPNGESLIQRMARRLRYWINSFRGFAIYDVREIDDRTRV